MGVDISGFLFFYMHLSVVRVAHHQKLTGSSLHHKYSSLISSIRAWVAYATLALAESGEGRGKEKSYRVHLWVRCGRKASGLSLGRCYFTFGESRGSAPRPPQRQTTILPEGRQTIYLVSGMEAEWLRRGVIGSVYDSPTGP